MGGELVPTNSPQQVSPITEAERHALHFVKSGMFPNLTSVHQAVVKILAGKELGLGPFASIDGFDIIKGRISPSGNLCLAMIRSSSKYDYRVKRRDAKGCVLSFYFKKADGSLGEHLGDCSFGEAEARQAGLLSQDNYKKYPSQMYLNRAATDGQKMFCPDMFCGAKVYTPEELGGIPSRDDLPAQPQSTEQTQDAEIEKSSHPWDDAPGDTEAHKKLKALLRERKIPPSQLAEELGVGEGDLTNLTEVDAARAHNLLRYRKTSESKNEKVKA